MEFVSANTIGPTIFKNFIDPELQKWGAGIPINGMLKDHEVMFLQQTLLHLHINKKVWIQTIHVTKRHVVKSLGGVGKYSPHARCSLIGMKIQYQSFSMCCHRYAPR